MLSFSFPSSNCLKPEEEKKVTLDKNACFSYLITLDKKLRAAKDSMEPYFKKYEGPDGRNLFKTVTSNFESFKQTRYEISLNRNTPCVSNAWIKAFEIIFSFGLIPEEKELFASGKDAQWNHFDNCSFPGSFVLAIYHYVYTHRNASFQSAYNWFASSLLADVTQDAENPGAALGDQYELYKRYSVDSTDGFNHWLMSPKEGLNGDILDLDYIEHIEMMLGNQVDLYTSEFGVDVSEKKMYNEQEFVHAKGDLSQIICGLKTMRNGGNMVCKIFTFFNPFTISMIALTRECFGEFYICKPASSKPDNSEVFLIGKKFDIEAGREALPIMMRYFKEQSVDYKNDTLVDIRKLNPEFWNSIKQSAFEIFEKLQIARIRSSISSFDQLVANYGDPVNNYNAESIIKRVSREKFKSRIEEDNTSWSEKNIVLVLNKKYRLNVVDSTEKKINNRPRGNASGSIGGYRGGGRSGDRGGGRSGDRGGSRGGDRGGGRGGSFSFSKF
jgi:hypothetical protein